MCSKVGEIENAPEKVPATSPTGNFCKDAEGFRRVLDVTAGVLSVVGEATLMPVVSTASTAVSSVEAGGSLQVLRHPTRHTFLENIAAGADVIVSGFSFVMFLARTKLVDLGSAATAVIGNLPVISLIPKALGALFYLCTLPTAISNYFKTQKKVEKLGKKILESTDTYDTVFLRKNDITQLKLDRDKQKLLQEGHKELSTFSIATIAFCVFSGIATAIGSIPVSGGATAVLGLAFSVYGLWHFSEDRERRKQIAKMEPTEIELTSGPLYGGILEGPSEDES